MNRGPGLSKRGLGLADRAVSLVFGILPLMILLWGGAPVLAQEYIRDTEPTPESIDQVVTPMDLAFQEKPTIPRFFPWLKERLKDSPPFFRDTRLDLKVRSYYYDQEEQESESEAWALGGALSYRSGWFLDRVSLGSVLYTSQRLYAPEDRDGTGLLQEGQHGYTVLGQLNARVRLFEQNFLNLYRYEYDTPFMNRNESRMTPNTFEGYTLTGGSGDKQDVTRFNYGLGYIDRIKLKNSDRFVWMSEAAGADVKRGVFTGGGRVSFRDVTIGAIDYYSKDILNIFYAESTLRLAVSDELRLLFTAQAADQRSVGEELLKGRAFKTNEFGIKTELGYRSGILTFAYTRNSSGADLQNPWSGYPGYTSVQVESFKRARENAFMAKFSYDLTRLGLEGVAAYVLYTRGWGAVDPSTGDPAPNRSEFDSDLQWRPSWKSLKGLWLRLRYAHVQGDGEPKKRTNNIRVIVNYDLSLL
jgi:hypothetical protein